MRSTGEVMASAADFATAFAKAERAAGRALPAGGRAFLTVRDADKVAVVPIAPRARAARLRADRDRGHGARARAPPGSRSPRSRRATPVVELLRRRAVDLVVNTPAGGNARRDGYAIREAAVVARVPCITTLAGARAAVEAIAKARAEPPISLQERHAAEREALACRVVSGAGSPASRRSARTRSSASRAAGSTRAARASSSCSRRPAACCRARSRSASRRAASSRS